MRSLLILLVVLVAFLWPVDIFAKFLSINTEKCALKTGPGAKYIIKYEYSRGVPFKVLQTKGNWVEVTDFEGETGWVSRKNLSTTQYVIVRSNKGKNKKIIIRSGPGLNDKTVGQAYYGVVFKVLEAKKGWVKVKNDSGLIGWAKSDFFWGL